MQNLKTGFARLCITPPLGVPVCGYYEQRVTKGTLDDLYVTAVAFDDGKNKCVVVAADLIHISTEVCDIYRKMIAESCNIPFEAVFINCSHTHTGPLTEEDYSYDLTAFNAYKDFLAHQINDAAVYAFEDLSSSVFYTAESQVKNISFIRRFRMKDGSVRTNPGINNPDVDHALGTPNETVKLLKIVREDNEDIFIVNFGTHPDTIGGELISADWPGFVCSTIEDAIPDTKCMFLLAPQGDVNHVNPFPTEADLNDLEITFDGVPRGYEHAKHMGRAIAGAVLQICGKAKKLELGELLCAESTIVCPSNQENDRLEEAKRIYELHTTGRDCELPYKEMELTTVVAEATRIVKLENGPDSYSFNITAIKIGNMAFVGIPGEQFSEIANRIYAGSPFETTILCCLTNGAGGYFPTSSAYDEGGYEARSCYLKKGADDIVVNGTIDLLNKLKNN